jgi:uncharacterized damage-inducible protein DinB
MHPQIAPLAEILTLNQRLFAAALEGVAKADASRRIEGTGNSLLWIAGHVANSRRTLARTAGAKIESYRPDLFGRGALPVAASAYPDLAAIQQAWNEAVEALGVRLEALNAAELRAAPPFNPPVADKSVLGAMAFLTMHECYHLGQLGYVRRLLGCETLAG